MAKDFGLKLGDHLTVNLLGREITGTIANLREIDWSRLSINFFMVFSPGVLEAAPQTEIATVRIDSASEVALERAVTDRFANISAIRVKEALASVARILDGLSAAVASMAGVALVAGIAVLAGAVLADRRRRIYDAVVLKVLGATRGNLLAGLALEYGFMGLATSLIALPAGQRRRLWLRPLGDGELVRLSARRGAGHGGDRCGAGDPHRACGHLARAGTEGSAPAAQRLAGRITDPADAASRRCRRARGSPHRRR